MEENYAKKKCWPAKVLLFFLCLSAEIISFSLFRFSLHIYIYIYIYIAFYMQNKSSKEADNKWFKTKIPSHTTLRVFFFLYHHPHFCIVKPRRNNFPRRQFEQVLVNSCVFLHNKWVPKVICEKIVYYYFTNS